MFIVDYGKSASDLTDPVLQKLYNSQLSFKKDVHIGGEIKRFIEFLDGRNLFGK